MKDEIESEPMKAEVDVVERFGRNNASLMGNNWKWEGITRKRMIRGSIEVRKGGNIES